MVVKAAHFAQNSAKALIVGMRNAPQILCLDKASTPEKPSPERDCLERSQALVGRSACLIDWTSERQSRTGTSAAQHYGDQPVAYGDFACSEVFSWGASPARHLRFQRKIITPIVQATNAGPALPQAVARGDFFGAEARRARAWRATSRASRTYSPSLFDQSEPQANGGSLTAHALGRAPRAVGFSHPPMHEPRATACGSARASPCRHPSPFAQKRPFRPTLVQQPCAQQA
jgi:hypothetical protein